MTKIYTIQPGDWEGATGELVDNDKHVIEVRHYRKLEKALTAANARISELERAIKEAIDHAGGRESEWGERAEECFAILEKVQP